MKYDLISRANRHKLKLEWVYTYSHGYSKKIWEARFASYVVKVLPGLPFPKVNTHNDTRGDNEEMLSHTEKVNLAAKRKGVHPTVRQKKAMAELLLHRIIQGSAIKAENDLNAWNNLTKE